MTFLVVVLVLVVVLFTLRKLRRGRAKSGPGLPEVRYHGASWKVGKRWL